MFVLQKKKCHLGNLKVSNSKLTFQNFGNLSSRIDDETFIIKPSGVNLNTVNYKDYPIISIKKKIFSFKSIYIHSSIHDISYQLLLFLY